MQLNNNIFYNQRQQDIINDSKVAIGNVFKYEGDGFTDTSNVVVSDL